MLRVAAWIALFALCAAFWGAFGTLWLGALRYD